MSVDFTRDVRCVLGLPFDALTEAAAEAALRTAVRDRTRCFLSTPNLNFAIGCLTDPAFRDSVLDSDINLADGWPIVTIARLLRTALPERVAGSNLFERLRRSNQRPPVAVYFFGGPEGAAAAACDRLNREGAGVRCVGQQTPGFGDVASMSTPTQLDHLNAAKADFVVVALGAKKGQAWIEHNLPRIDAPVVSHLGAVVNFTAGTLRRAPIAYQRLRLEWLWRIVQEPGLWRRYAHDAGALSRLLVTRVLPHALALRLQPTTAADAAPAVVVCESSERTVVLRLTGALQHANLGAMRQTLQSMLPLDREVVLDLSHAARLDSAAVGLLALLYGAAGKAGVGWQLLGASGAARRALRGMCADYLLINRIGQPSS
jgi:N-acetylglucosaminyldiphosphoundecaprenol N-acetyl-beta-D-mannosaminyltransferase